MVQFNLPKNSQVTTGKTWSRPASAKNVREYRIYRWNPDDARNPRIDTYFVDLDDCGPMVLDALIWIKNKIDSDAHLPPLLPRGHLRLVRDEYRRNQHARLHPGHADDRRRGPHLSAAAYGGGEGSRSRPHQFLRPARLDRAVAQDRYAGAGAGMAADATRTASKLDGLYECILCACCSTSCPSYWWNGDRYLGPAALLQAYRWLIDSRDEATGRAARQSRRSVPALSLPHDHELRQGLPEGSEPGQGHRRHQEDDDRAARLSGAAFSNGHRPACAAKGAGVRFVGRTNRVAHEVARHRNETNRQLRR